MGLFEAKSSLPFHSEVGMPSVMPNQSDTYAISQFAVNEMIWEPVEIRAMEARFD